MTPAKLNVFFSFFPYGGNGATSSEVPAIRNWFARTYHKAKNDPRVGEIFNKDFSDTPITMTRNLAVLEARMAGADVLVMCDSDQHPDVLLGEKDAKPFWDSSFDFLYERKMQEKATVVGAPYCGPPPVENVYIFRWATWESNGPVIDSRVEAYAREEAAMMIGIQEVAALPTGLIMFDMKVLDVTDPIHEYRSLLKKHPQQVAEALTKPWFYYEWENIYQSNKASTEDVTATRDIGLLCLQQLGYPVLFCNWNAWAGHYKPKCVSKPVVVTADQVNEKYRAGVARGVASNEKLVEITPDGKWLQRALNLTPPR